ncbi:Hypothetical predicted protein [Cloeon dipterum]|nr:Hypothetical predicted protein [Cloeon dipterum]
MDLELEILKNHKFGTSENIATLEGEVNKLKISVVELTAESERCGVEIKKSISDTQELDSKTNGLEIKLRKLEEKDRTQEQYQKKEENLNQLNDKLASFMSEVEGLNKTFGETTEECKMLRNECQESINNHHQVLQAMQSRLEKLEGVTNEDDKIATLETKVNSFSQVLGLESKQCRVDFQESMKRVEKKINTRLDVVQTKLEHLEAENDIVEQYHLNQVEIHSKMIEAYNKGRKAKRGAQKSECARNNGLMLTVLENGKTYHFSNIARDWSDAKEFCESHEMHLASIRTEQDLQVLGATARGMDLDRNLWLSASDVGRALGDFQWHDGQVLPRESELWEKVAQGPNSFSSCVALPVKGISFKLSGHNCKDKKYVLCESPVTYC